MTILSCNSLVPRVHTALIFCSDAAAGILVGTVVATDSDVTAPNNDINYVITSGAGTDFELGSVTSGKYFVEEIKRIIMQTAIS